MKVKNFCKRLVGDYRILITEGMDEDGDFNVVECCKDCAAKHLGDEKISQILIDGSTIHLILKKTGIIIIENEKEGYDDDDYDDDEFDYDDY